MLNWGGRVVGWMRATFPADHKPLYSGMTAMTPDSARPELRVLVMAAPYRTLPSRTLDPDLAIELVRSYFADVVSKDPDFSMPDFGVRFQSGANANFVYVNGSGRIDLNVYLPLIERDGLRVPLLETMKPIAKMVEVVTSPNYRRVFPKTTRRRYRRFDWYIGVGPTVAISDRGAVSWNGIEFPGPTPARAGTNQQAHCPM